MIIQATRSKKSEVNMVPLMDSMFLLLVFFIYAMMSMVLQHNIPVTLPEASTSTLSTEEHKNITINAKGNIFFNKFRVNSQELAAKIQAVENKNDPIFINAHKDSKHEWLIQVMDILRQEGVYNVAFQTQMETQP